MKKLLLTLLFLLGFMACNKKQEPVPETVIESKVEIERLKVVTTIFSTYDFAKEIGKEKAEVKLLLPPGIEAHSYEPTPRDIADINNADVFIYTSKEMEPWVEKLLNSLSNKDLIIVDASKGIQMKEFNFDDHKHEHNDENHEEETHGVDPHIWTDPLMAISIVENIYQGFVSANAENKDFFESNKLAYTKKLNELDEKFTDLISKSKKREIISGGHFVFGYLINRLELTYHSAYESFSPNAEPTPNQMKELKEAIKEVGTKYVYFEVLVDPKLAKLLSQELGMEMLLLHGAHNVSKEEIEKGLSYYDIMIQNIENLKLGSEYDEKNNGN